MTTRQDGAYSANLFLVLTVVFVVLKLAGVIHWSWWLVLLPFLIPVGILIAALVIGAAAAVLTVLFKRRR